MANWQVFDDRWNQGSFPAPVPAPNANPGAAPVVCVQFGAPWLPYVLGSLFQLTQPSTWDPTSTGYADAVGQAQSLMAIFSAAGVCTDMLQFQFTSGCGLQYSVDAGGTWIDVPGWDTYAPTCFTGPIGPIGPTGATGGYSPGSAGNPQGVTVPQQGCNIASYLAADIIQVSLAQQVSNYNSAKSLVDSVGTIFGAIGFVDPILGLAVAAATVLYNYYTAGSIGEFTTASTDATLLADVRCAIYGAISADGQVTPGNFAAVLTAIAGISYTYPTVISAIHDYVSAFGVVGIQQLQLQGSMYVGDCSACSSPPLNALAFTRSSPTVVSMTSNVPFGSGAFTLGMWFTTTGTAGLLWESGTNGVAENVMAIFLNGSEIAADPRTPTTGDVVFSGGTVNDGSPHLVVFRSAGSGGACALFVDGVIVASTGTYTGSLDASGAGTALGNGAGVGGFPGDMWGVAPYVGAALSDAAIAAWYAGGTSAPPPAGATHYWPFSDGVGTTVTDTAAGNNGTITGTYAWVTHP